MYKTAMRPVRFSLFKKDATPGSKRIWPEIKDVVIVKSLSNLAALISTKDDSFAFSPTIFSAPIRSKESFSSVDVLMLDYDSKGTLEEAIEAFKNTGLAFVAGTTFNHQKAKANQPPVDRYRIIVPTSSPITNASLMQYNLEQLATFTWPFYDNVALTDSSRCYLPCKEVVHIQEGNLWETLTEEVYGSLCVPGFIKDFVNNTPGEGAGFNAALYKAAVTMKRAGYPEEKAYEFFQKFIFQEHFNPEGWDRITREDEQTIRSAFRGDKGPAYDTKASFESKRRGTPIPGEDAANLMKKLINDELPKHLAIYRGASGDKLFKIIDYDNRIVELVQNPAHICDKVIIGQVLNKSEYAGIPRIMSEAKKILKAWEELPAVIDHEPEPFKQKEEINQWAYERIDIALEEGETPAWDEFLTRLSSPDDFLAWVWSCYEIRNRARQLLWLYGPEGEDGKSAVLRLIYESFGKAGTTIQEDNLKTQFGLSTLYGKRFAYDADALNTRLLQSKKLRNLTTGDAVTIEFKGENAFSASIYLKIAVGSNMKPSINDINAERSRLIIIRVNKTEVQTANWEQQLRKEYPRLLYKAYKKYVEKCPDHYNIKLDAQTKEMVDNAAVNGSSDFADIFDRCLEIVPGAKLRAYEYRQILKEEGVPEVARHRFEEYVDKRIREEYKDSKGVVYKRDNKGNYIEHLSRKGTVLTGFKGLK